MQLSFKWMIFQTTTLISRQNTTTINKRLNSIKLRIKLRIMLNFIWNQLEKNTMNTMNWGKGSIMQACGEGGNWNYTAGLFAWPKCFRDESELRSMSTGVTVMLFSRQPIVLFSHGRPSLTRLFVSLGIDKIFTDGQHTTLKHPGRPDNHMGSLLHVAIWAMLPAKGGFSQTLV